MTLPVCGQNLGKDTLVWISRFLKVPVFPHWKTLHHLSQANDVWIMLIWENPRWMIFEVIQVNCDYIKRTSFTATTRMHTGKAYLLRHTKQPTSTHNKLFLASCFLNTINSMFCMYSPDTHTLLSLEHHSSFWYKCLTLVCLFVCSLILSFFM